MMILNSETGITKQVNCKQVTRSSLLPLQVKRSPREIMRTESPSRVAQHSSTSDRTDVESGQNDAFESDMHGLTESGGLSR